MFCRFVRARKRTICDYLQTLILFSIHYPAFSRFYFLLLSLFFFSFLLFLHINICKYVPFVHRRSGHGESLISIEWLNTSNREETYFFIFFFSFFFFLHNFLQHFSVKCKNRYFIASYIFFLPHLFFFFRGFSSKTSFETTIFEIFPQTVHSISIWFILT